MSNNRKHGERRPVQPDKVVQDLLSFFLASFKKSNWRERLHTLEQIDAQISHDFGGKELCRCISRMFTFEILQRLDTDLVTCSDQAFIFLNSQDERHRQAGRAWFILNQVPCALLDDDSVMHIAPGADHRMAARHSVHIASLVAANDSYTAAQLVDISATGAKVAIDTPPPAGTEIILDIPFLGRVAGMVVWVATSFIGVFFLSNQMPRAVG